MPDSQPSPSKTALLSPIGSSSILKSAISSASLSLWWSPSGRSCFWSFVGRGDSASVSTLACGLITSLSDATNKLTSEARAFELSNRESTLGSVLVDVDVSGGSSVAMAEVTEEFDERILSFLSLLLSARVPIRS